MNKKEFAVFVSAIKTYYPKEQLLPNQQAIALWYRELCDIPADVATAALRKWVATNKWSPTIADIREQAMVVQTGEMLLWSDAWEKVLLAIKKYGSYGQDRAMASFNEMTRQAVRRIGWLELCRSTNTAADRANFRMIFEQLADREYNANKLSISLQQLIEKERGQIASYDGKRLLDAGHKAGQADQ